MYQLVCSYFVIYFGFLVKIIMNQSAQERPFYYESIESISFFIAYIGLHNTYFHLDYNCYNGLIILQRIPHNLTVARLLHKRACSLVKMLLKNWQFSKETVLFETIKNKKIMNVLHTT